MSLGRERRRQKSGAHLSQTKQKIGKNGWGEKEARWGGREDGNSEQALRGETGEGGKVESPSIVQERKTNQAWIGKYRGTMSNKRMETMKCVQPKVGDREIGQAINQEEGEREINAEEDQKMDIT